VTPRQATRASASKTFIDIPEAPGLNEPARLLAVPFTLNGRDMVLVVGATRENGLETLAAVRARMLRAGPILLLVTSLMAYLLAAAALRPVERMRRQATHLNLTASGQRLSVPRTRDEIARLGETLNELLARVEMSVNRERRFVANASHELRTPLALLRTEFDLATRRPRTPAERSLCGQAVGSPDTLIIDDARLDPRDPALWIKFKNLRHVLREIENNRNVAALAGERGASTAAQDRRAMLSADSNRSDHVLGIARDYNSDRNLAVIRAVGGVERAASVVEAYVSAKLP